VIFVACTTGGRVLSARVFFLYHMKTKTYLMELLAVILALCLFSAFANAAQFTLTWTDNSTNEQGFIIERAPGLNATNGFLAIGLVGVDVRTFVDPGLPPTTPYSYRVCAYNVKGKSAYSNVASGTTSVIPVDATLPAAPSGTGAQTDTPYTPPVITTNLTIKTQGENILAMSVDAQATNTN
jgi:hypothetical protein